MFDAQLVLIVVLSLGSFALGALARLNLGKE
jgi:hypothetical protein